VTINAADLERAQAQAAAPSRNGHGPERFQVLVAENGKLMLPELPGPDDIAGFCGWLTGVFNLNWAQPITGGMRQGLRSHEGHVVLTRADAPAIRFEPASRINTPTKLIETLNWQMSRQDGAVHALKGEHCRVISQVVRMLCDAGEAISAEQEAEAIVGTFLHAAQPVDGEHTTYGTSGQRYEAAVALRRAVDEITGRPAGPARYLIDANTGELVIAVSDLQDAARRHTGSSLAHGWLDGRMESLDWRRLPLSGYGMPGRDGRKGPHARVNVYRGLLRSVDEDEATPEAAVST
jgi:hypothetical protein